MNYLTPPGKSGGMTLFVCSKFEGVIYPCSPGLTGSGATRPPSIPPHPRSTLCWSSSLAMIPW